MRTEVPKEDFSVLTGEFGRATINLIQRPIAPHIHTQYNWIIKLDGADAEFSNRTDRLLLDDSTVLIFNPMEEHAKADHKERPILALSLLIEPAWLREMFSQARRLPPQNFPRSRETITEEIHQLAVCLANAISQTDRYEAKSAPRLLRELAAAMVRSYHEPAVANCSSNIRPSDFRIRNALGFISQNLSACLTVEKVARNVGLSRSRFFEQFKGCIGVSPQHYIDSTRVSCATRLLTSSTASLSEISDELGFSQASHFTRFFIQHTGVAPSTFRRNTLSLDE